MDQLHTIYADNFFSDKCKLSELPIGKVRLQKIVCPLKNICEVQTSKGKIALEFTDKFHSNSPVNLLGIWHIVQDNQHCVFVISEQMNSTAKTHTFTTRIITIHTNSGKKTHYKVDQFCGFDIAQGTFAMMEVLGKLVAIKVFDVFTLNSLFQTSWYNFCSCEYNKEDTDSQIFNCSAQCLHKFKGNLVEIYNNRIIFVETVKKYEWSVVEYNNDHKKFMRTHVNDIIMNSKVPITVLINITFECYNLMFFANDTMWVDMVSDPDHLVVFDIKHNLVKKVLLPTTHGKPIHDCVFLPFSQTFACVWYYNNTICIVIMNLYGHQHFCKEYVVDAKTKLYLLEFVDGYAVVDTDMSIIDHIPFGL